MTQPTPLDLAAADLEDAKEQEALARERRLACEEAIIALVGINEEGAKTTKTAYYKVTTTAKLIRTIDAEAEIPYEILQRITRIKSELDVSAFKALEKEDPGAYAIACQAVTAKPAKPSVTVTLLKQEEQSA